MHFDSLVIGNISFDTNVDYGGQPVDEIGGAVYYSGYSAAATGSHVAVLAKANLSEVDIPKIFSQAENLAVYPVPSPVSTRIVNIYTSPERERRISRLPSNAAPFTMEEIPANVEADVYDLASLQRGDFSEEFILALSKRGPVALDLQGMLRYAVDGTAVFGDWAAKREVLPHIRYLKADANEAEIITGLTDRYAAARQILEWGCPEVMITHNTEVIVATPQGIRAEPLRPRNLSGRTGRGDTTFACYLCERLHGGIPEALRYAAACVSLKIETPGPFKGGRKDVLDYIDKFYKA